MRRWLGCATALLLLPLAVPAQAGGCGNGSSAPHGVCGPDGAVVIESGGLFREFHFYVPPAIPDVTPAPLVIALPGLSLEPSSVEQDSGFDRFADSAGTVVAYPRANQGSWNAGTCCGDSAVKGVDDVGFLVQLVATVARLRPVDLDRVYLAGFSNGGMLALRALCERPDVFAAAASMAGTLQAPCPAGPPVSALLVSGGKDRTVPYAGLAYSDYLHTTLTPVPVTAGTLAARDRCTGTTTRPGRPFSSVSHTGCAAGSEVEVVRAPALQHAWPQQSVDGFDGGVLAWEFLRRHTRVSQAS